MATFLGNNLQILTPVTGGYSAIIAMAKSCEISVEGSQIEVSSPTSGQWRYYLAGRKGWQVNVSYLLSSGTFPTEAQMVNTQVVIVVSDGSVQMQGNAIVKSWKSNGAVGSLAKGAFQFLGNGALSPI